METWTDLDQHALGRFISLSCASIYCFVNMTRTTMGMDQKRTHQTHRRTHRTAH